MRVPFEGKTALQTRDYKPHLLSCPLLCLGGEEALERRCVF